MKEKNFKIIFLVTVILLIVFSVYYIIKKQNILEKEIKLETKKIIINKEIIFGVTAFDTPNPILSKSQDIQYISKLIYEPLINIGQDFKLEKGLGIEWNKLNDKTYLIKLDENKIWQNRENFTARDVEYTINYIKQEDSIYNENVKNIEKIDIINDYIVKIHLKEPEENFEYMLNFPIVCKQENIGTGNFYISTIDKEQIILKSKTNKQIITIKIYENTTNLYKAFSKEEIDLFITNNIYYDKFIGNIGYNKKYVIGREFDLLKFNLNKKILQNPEVVQAIFYGINKSEIINKVYNNRYLQAEFPLQYGSYLYNDNVIYEYNQNNAKQILENAGWEYNRRSMG